MNLVASLAAGIFTYLFVGLLVGYPMWVGRTRTGRRGGRQEWLVQAGVGLSPSRFWLLSALSGMAGLVAGMAITGLPTVAFILGLAAGGTPWLVLGRKRSRRLAAVREAWPDALRDIGASVAAGASVAKAIETMTRTGPEPLRVAFQRYPLLSRSIGVAPALEVIRQQLADPTSDRVIEVLILAHERGGSLVREILSDLAAVTSQDRWTLEEIRTATLEQKINARAVFVLPWLVLVALTGTSDAYRQFYASSGGVLVVGIAALASAAGMALVVRLGREPEEPRVLVSEERS